jgi:hypothetical protein
MLTPMMTTMWTMRNIFLKKTKRGIPAFPPPIH